MGVRGQAYRSRTGPESRVCFSAEDSPSGLGRTLGKRVGGNPSRVQISYPPPQLVRANEGPDRFAGRDLRRWCGADQSSAERADIAGGPVGKGAWGAAQDPLDVWADAQLGRARGTEDVQRVVRELRRHALGHGGLGLVA